MLPDEPFDPGTELIDMAELHLLFVLLRVGPVLLLGIRIFEGSLISMETVMGKCAAFGNLSFPGILKCLGCRMSGPNILQADLVRRIRSDGCSFLPFDWMFLSSSDSCRSFRRGSDIFRRFEPHLPKEPSFYQPFQQIREGCSYTSSRYSCLPMLPWLRRLR